MRCVNRFSAYLSTDKPPILCGLTSLTVVGQQRRMSARAGASKLQHGCIAPVRANAQRSESNGPPMGDQPA
jgi:hypothetical protein